MDTSERRRKSGFVVGKERAAKGEREIGRTRRVGREQPIVATTSTLCARDIAVCVHAARWEPHGRDRHTTHAHVCVRAPTRAHLHTRT